MNISPNDDKSKVRPSTSNSTKSPINNNNKDNAKLLKSVNGTTLQALEHLRCFLQLGAQAPLEVICKSALYLLKNIPSARFAVLEYIGVFYKIGAYLDIRFNLIKKNTSLNQQQQLQQTDDANNIQHINQALDLIEDLIYSQFLSTSNSRDYIEVWSIELSQWLIDTLGEIISNNNMAYSNLPGVSSEEAITLNSMSLIDSFEMWSSNCRPSYSIVKLIQKCITLLASNPLLQATIIDKLLVASKKYGNLFDCFLCNIGALLPSIMFERVLYFGFKEVLASKKTPSTGLSKMLSPNSPLSTASNNSEDSKNNNELPRINMINFYSLNYSNIVRKVIISFLVNNSNNNDDTNNKSALLYILKMATKSNSLLILLINEIFSFSCFSESTLMPTTTTTTTSSSYNNDKHEDTFNEPLHHFSTILQPYLISDDPEVKSYLIKCIKLLNNNIAVFELILFMIKWLKEEQTNEKNNDNLSNLESIYTTIVNYFRFLFCFIFGNNIFE
jgi:hypothetical protein